MTDIDNLKMLLDSWGVPHSPYEDPDARPGDQDIKVGGWTHQNDPRGTVAGYNGHYTVFEFDVDGKFTCMGAWE